MTTDRMKRKVQEKPAKQKEKKRPAAWKIVLFCSVLLGCCIFAKAELDIYSETVTYRRQLAELQAQQKETSLSIAEKEELCASILSEGATDDKILRIIRSKGYVYPDEIIFYDVVQNLK